MLSDDEKSKYFSMGMVIIFAIVFGFLIYKALF
jgi:hypothetical protein